MITKQVILKKGREKSVKNRHPWLFSGAISRVEGDPSNGDVVDVWSGGAGDILVIQSGKEEVLIPAIAEFIKEVELDKGRIIVRMWEEM